MLVIYHGPACSDGFSAAWAVKKAHPDAILHPATHGDNPPDVTGKDVVIVDFAYPRKVTERLIKEAKSFLLLDHHKTAMEDLAGLPNCHFDMHRSGARMAWDYFHDNKPNPFMDYVQDQDLWLYSLPSSKQVNAYIGSWHRKEEAWDFINAAIRDEPEYVAIQGQAIVNYQENLIYEAVKAAREVTIKQKNEGFFGWFWDFFDPLPSYNVLITNCLGDFRSEVAARLAKDRPFAICWRQLKDGRYAYSLRANKNSEYAIDLTDIAKQFGGGGHPTAAAFTASKLLF